MKTSIRGSILLVFAATTLTFLFFGCSGEKSKNVVEPTPTQEFNIFFYDSEALQNCYSYNTATRAIDSFPIPLSSIDDIKTVSPDGKLMYISQGDNIIEYSLESFTTLRQTTVSGLDSRLMKVSSNNQYLAVRSPQVCRILQLSDFTVVFEEPALKYELFFTPNDSLLLYGSFSSELGNFIQVVDLTDNFSTSKRLINTSTILEINSNQDGTIWYIYSRLGMTMCRFSIFDALQDTLLVEQYIDPGPGIITVSPDNKYVAFSQSGTIMTVMPNPPTYFTLYNGHTNQLTDTVNALVLDTGMVRAVWPIGDLYFTPDGNHLFGFGVQGFQFFDYCPNNNTFDTVIFQGYNNFLHFLGCQAIE